jgi:hypothetical protein
LAFGSVELQAQEAAWAFTPERVWVNGEYRLLVNPELEDLAGNTPLRVFDTDLRKADPQPSILDLGFRPRPIQ